MCHIELYVISCKMNNNNVVMFTTRKMLSVNRFIVEALVERYAKCHGINIAYNCLGLTRLNVNRFAISLIATFDDKHVHANESSSRERFKLDGTALMLHMISSAMRSVQQTNLNAKHCSKTIAMLRDNTQSNVNTENNDTLNKGDICSVVRYIDLNRSCAQRRIIEICCVCESKSDAEFVANNVSSCVLIQMLPSPIDATELYIMYVATDKQEWINILKYFVANGSNMPSLLFTSSKNQVYFHVKKYASESHYTSDLCDVALISYVSNFLMYYIFHTCDCTFDINRMGNSFVTRCGLAFLLSLVNTEMLRVSFGRIASVSEDDDIGLRKVKKRKIHTSERSTAKKPRANETNNTCNISATPRSLSSSAINISLNMQSLGKAFNDVGLQIFSENSVYFVKKVHGVSCYTNGCLVNRYYGRCSNIGINAFSMTVRLFPPSHDARRRR